MRILCILVKRKQLAMIRRNLRVPPPRLLAATKQEARHLLSRKRQLLAQRNNRCVQQFGPRVTFVTRVQSTAYVILPTPSADNDDDNDFISTTPKAEIEQ